MKMAAMAAVNSAVLNPNLKVHWTSSAEAFDRALNAIVDVLKAAPILEVVRQIQAADPARPLNKTSKRQRAMLRLRDELGDLVDRPGRLLKPQKPKPKRSKKK
jgi:hypothetical protein